MISLTAFPIAGGLQTGWLITQDERDVALFVDDDLASECAHVSAHRASLLGVLAARPLVMHVDSTVEHLPALHDTVALANRCRVKTGAPRIDVRVRIVLVSPLDCAHPVTALVTPQIGERQGQPCYVCKCCGSFTDGPDWVLSAPDVDAVRFPDDGPAEVVPWPDGAVFVIHSEGSNA